MAKTKTKNKTIQNPKLKTSIFLCCFGPPTNNKASEESLTATTNYGSDSTILKKQKRRTNKWFSWVKIRIRKHSASKTVPLEAHYSKVKSKSTLHHRSQAPATNSVPLTQALPVDPATPYYTPSQTRHGPSNNTHGTHQQRRGSPTMQEKRQPRRVSSSSMQPQTTSTRKQNNVRGSSNDGVAGMSVVVVTLVIMIFWGRICAILCTSVWFYCIPRFRNNVSENYESIDLIKKMKIEAVDMDSEEYKKKVIMEGLLKRNHIRG